VVGAGLLVIHRSVLETLPPIDGRRGKKWFDWRLQMQGILPPGEAMSEDFTMCLHARRSEMGYKILVDTSVQARHIGYAESTFGRFKPCEANPVT
jgi:hypothetical protein